MAAQASTVTKRTAVQLEEKRSLIGSRLASVPESDSNSAPAAAAASAAPVAHSPDSWTVAVALRQRVEGDHPSIKTLADLTGSPVVHVEFVVRYPCGTPCQWCQNGAPKPRSNPPIHYVLYTVRDTDKEKGVLCVSKNPVLPAGGKWTLYAVIASAAQIKTLQKYCDAHVGDQYQSRTEVMCARMCCHACAYPRYTDIIAMEDDDMGVHAHAHCSGYVAAALLRAGLLRPAKGEQPVEPYTTTPAEVAEKIRQRTTEFTLLSEIPPDLQDPGPKKHSPAAAARA